MTTEDAAGSEPVGTQLTVLVVEDDGLVRALVRELLTGAGYRVLTAADAPAGQELALREPTVDAFIVDAFVPGGGGAPLAEKLRSHHPEAAVLLVSGAEEGVHEHSDFRFLAKPFSGAALDEALRLALADRSRRFS